MHKQMKRPMRRFVRRVLRRATGLRLAHGVSAQTFREALGRLEAVGAVAEVPRDGASPSAGCE